MTHKQISRKSPPSRRKSKQTSKYRVRNWAHYNASLVQRGSITFWVSPDMVRAWKPRPDRPRQRGGQVRFSDVAIECLLTVRVVFHLTLRATEGFARSLFEMMKVNVEVPDYTTLCKRAKQLNVPLPTTAHGPIHAVLDSTGLKVFGEGEWKVRKHGYSKRRTWRKLHLSVDSATHEIQAMLLTEASLDDAEATPELLDQTSAAVEQLSADGAYDKRKVYITCEKHGVQKITIPPRRDAHIWQHGNCAAPSLPRDENLRRIRVVGRRQWKDESGYHQRSLAETAMFRFKTIFGDHLSSRVLHNQKTEARIKCAALNRMTQLGMPDSYRVA
jgi:hypothetical protein